MSANLPGGAIPNAAVDQNFLALAALFPLGAESLKDVFIAKVAKLPAAGKAGQIVYDEATKTFYGYNGTEWAAFNRKINFGTGTYIFSASNKSGVLTVNHGLGVTPTAIELTMERSVDGEGVFQPQVIAGSKNSTSFKTKAVHTASVTIELGYMWVAVG